jgi:hypothetical protein
MLKKSVLSILVFTVLLVFFPMHSYSGDYDVLKNVKASFKKDRHGNINVTVFYKIKWKHVKFSYHEINRGSMWMDCITSYDSRGYLYKKVVSSCQRAKKLTDRAGQMKMVCYVGKSYLSSKSYYMWVRLKAKVAGSWETHWVKAGRIK